MPLDRNRILCQRPDLFLTEDRTTDIFLRNIFLCTAAGSLAHIFDFLFIDDLFIYLQRLLIDQIAVRRDNPLYDIFAKPP